MFEAETRKIWVTELVITSAHGIVANADSTVAAFWSCIHNEKENIIHWAQTHEPLGPLNLVYVPLEKSC